MREHFGDEHPLGAVFGRSGGGVNVGSTEVDSIVTRILVKFCF